MKRIHVAILYMTSVTVMVLAVLILTLTERLELLWLTYPLIGAILVMMVYVATFKKGWDNE